MKTVFFSILFLLTFAATAQDRDSFPVRQYPWSMNALPYPRTPGCDSLFAEAYNEMRYYDSDSLFYKIATQGRTLEVEDLLHYFYHQILEDHAPREKIDEECRKMRCAAQTYRSETLEDEADYMETYFMQAGNDSLWNIKDARMNALVHKAAKKGHRANECRLLFELFHACLNHRQYDRAFKYAAVLLEKMKNMTDADYFKRRETYFHIGNAYYLFRDYQRAIACFRVAMQEGERLFFDRSGLRAKEKIARYYASVNQLDSSDYYYRALYHSPEQVRFRPMYDFVAIQGLANNGIQRGEYGKALALLQKFHPAILKTGISECIAANTCLLGMGYLETARLDKAKAMIDSMRIMLMKSKALVQPLYPRIAKEVDFRFKGWYDLMSRYCQKMGKPGLAHLYRDSVYIINLEEREETNALTILRAEQELFETEQRLAGEQIRTSNYRLAAISIAFVLMLAAFLIFVYFNRKMRKAYRELVRRSIEWADTKHPVSKPVAESSAGTHERDIMHKIYKLFEDERVYTDIDCSLPKLATLLNVSHRNYVSEAINSVCKCNFNTFINDYRIKFAIKMLNDPGYDKYSLEQVTEISGFANRQSFYTAFKSKTGLTPAAFRKNRQEDLKIS